jgi:hypothetical protein
VVNHRYDPWKIVAANPTVNAWFRRPLPAKFFAAVGNVADAN